MNHCYMQRSGWFARKIARDIYGFWACRDWPSWKIGNITLHGFRHFSNFAALPQLLGRSNNLFAAKLSRLSLAGFFQLWRRTGVQTKVKKNQEHPQQFWCTALGMLKDIITILQFKGKLMRANFVHYDEGGRYHSSHILWREWEFLSLSLVLYLRREQE